MSAATNIVSITRFQSELNRLFDEAMRLASGQPRAGEWQPPVDVVETPDALIVLVEVPGIRADDLEVSVQGDSVTLRGRKRPAAPDQPARFHCLEQVHGVFERRIELLHPVNTHAGKARISKGVLVVEFPKVHEKRESRRLLVIEDDDARVEAPEDSGEPEDEP